MISAGAAAQAQQQPSTPPQLPPPPTATKADKVCRIHMDTNIPRRVCMTKEQWAKIDAENADNSQQYNRPSCGATAVAGAC
jgi:hypothetical protein